MLWRTDATKIDESIVEQVLPAYQAALYRNVYLKMYQELSPRDRDFVNAMATSSTPVVSVAMIGKEMGQSKNYLSVYRRWLLDDQLITASERGKLAFTLPYFADFIRTFQELY